MVVSIDQSPEEQPNTHNSQRDVEGVAFLRVIAPLKTCVTFVLLHSEELLSFDLIELIRSAELTIRNMNDRLVFE